mmetsp:Transcript_486/g.1769  ORF Transcript_486/g.1769 Transcript_486/m.1769 type:complete len:216 (+) Transcript_486:2242-2889(+)
MLSRTSSNVDRSTCSSSGVHLVWLAGPLAGPDFRTIPLLPLLLLSVFAFFFPAAFHCLPLFLAAVAVLSVDASGSCLFLEMLPGFFDSAAAGFVSSAAGICKDAADTVGVRRRAEGAASSDGIPSTATSPVPPHFMWRGGGICGLWAGRERTCTPRSSGPFPYRSLPSLQGALCLEAVPLRGLPLRRSGPPPFRRQSGPLWPSRADERVGTLPEP